MYCPACGQRQNSGELRFCPRCGQQLDAVRACLSADGGPAPVVIYDAPRSGDINTGVLVVFLGVLATSAFVAFTNVPVPGAFLFLLLVCAPLLAASGRLLGAIRGLSPDGEAAARARLRPREVGFGAALMLVCTALSYCAATVGHGAYGSFVFFTALVALLVASLLTSQTLMRAAQRLIAGGSLPHAAAPAQSGRAADGEKSLPPAESVPAPFFGAREAATAEMLSPTPSVAERTTSLLEEVGTRNDER